MNDYNYVTTLRHQSAPNESTGNPKKKVSSLPAAYHPLKERGRVKKGTSNFRKNLLPIYSLVTLVCNC